MPPQLALLLCTVFVLFLLRLDRKQAPMVSRALWIPTIWMLYTGSKPLGAWFPSAGGDAESGSPLDRNLLIGLLCLGLFILTWRRFTWSSAMKEHIWVVLLIGYMLVSIVWSDIPFVSFKRWTRELVAVIMAFLLSTEQDPRQALQSVFRRTVYVLIPFSLLLIKYYPQYGIEFGRWSGMRMWIGVTTQKNGLGRLCLIVGFYLVWTLIKRWQGRSIPISKYQTPADVFLLIMTLWLLKGPPGAYSATSITALALGLATFVGLLRLKKRRIDLGANTLAVIMALVIGFGTVTPMVGGSTVSGFTSALGRDESLTGRTDIWAALVPIAMQKPILGGGFGSFWTSTTRVAYASEAHSGYLDVLLDLGLVGLLLFSMFLLSSCRRAQRAMAQDFDWGALWVCFLLMAVVQNISETSLGTFTSHLMAVLLFLLVCSTTATSSSWKVEEDAHRSSLGP